MGTIPILNLWGDPKQKLTMLDEVDHRQLHKDLNYSLVVGAVNNT